MWKTSEGSTGRLIQLCFFYFFFYVITGLTVKYYTPKVGDLEYTVFSTIGGNLPCILVTFIAGWYALKSTTYLKVRGITFPKEFLYIIPSGICTAVVIPTTTLMYTLPISVMVAMVIMRGSVIVISRVVDAIQIKQGILHKQVYWEEEMGVVFAILAVSINIFYSYFFGSAKGAFAFLHSAPALWILGSYLTAYSIRIYIMNFYKNTRPKHAIYDYKGFFGIEQISSTITMLFVGWCIFKYLNVDISQVVHFKASFTNPHSSWPWQILAGTSFGMVAFFSVFIFMFQGRTATFAGLVNRLTSLVAGTTSTLLFALWFGGKMPKTEEWLSLVFILIAVVFLTMAERRRATELKLTKEIETNNGTIAKSAKV